MSKFSQFLSKAMLKTAKKFDININDMQINVEDKTDELTEEQVKEVIVKENPTIYWSDDRAEHYIMDFPFEIDGKKYWCGSVKISNDLKSMDVKIWTTEPKQANTLRNIVKSAATVKEIEEIAKGYEQDLQGLGYKDMKVEPYFAYGKYGFYFNFTREDGRPGQKFTGLDTKNNTKLNLRNAYYDLINRKNWYLKRQAKQATKCAKLNNKKANAFKVEKLTNSDFVDLAGSIKNVGDELWGIIYGKIVHVVAVIVFENKVLFEPLINDEETQAIYDKAPNANIEELDLLPGDDSYAELGFVVKDSSKKCAKVNKKAEYANTDEALEELHKIVYTAAKNIALNSPFEKDEINDSEIREICSIAFRKGFNDGFEKAFGKTHMNINIGE